MDFSRPKLNIKETNLCNIGSELEKQVKQAAADGEPAWESVGHAPGIEVWRIEKFKVVPWPKAMYGQFYDGDSYIVLQTTEIEGVIDWDIYFWLGQYTSQDEAGTAAYKTVELDDKLGGQPVQHRVVQGKEGSDFLEMWPNGQLKIMAGGMESGFNHVVAGSATFGRETAASLAWVSGPTMRTVCVQEVPCSPASLSEEDCFVLDDGKGECYIYQGASSSPGERNKSGKYAQEVSDRRGRARVSVVTSSDAPPAFWEALGAGGATAGAVSALSTLASGFNEAAPAIRSRGGNFDFAEGATPSSSSRSLGSSSSPPPALLLRVNGPDSFDEVASTASSTTPVKGYTLNQDDLYLLLESEQASCWIGKNVDRSHKQKALQHANTALLQYGNPHAAISCFRQGRESKHFRSVVMA